MIIAIKLITGVVLFPAFLAFIAFLILRSDGAKLNREQTRKKHKEAMHEFMKLIPKNKPLQ